MRFNYIGVLSSALLILTQLAIPTSAKESSLPEVVDKVIEEELRQGRGPGAAIAIVKGNQIIFQSAYGKAKVGTDEALTPSHLFRSASTLKMMVGTVLAILSTQGKIDLHAPISQFIPDIDPALKAITPHQLLTHTSGLLDESMNDGDVADNALEKRMLKLGEKDLFVPRGTVFSYSNPGFSLAGYLIERVTGKPFSKAMHDILFQPLGMKRSTFDLDRAIELGMAFPHQGRGTAMYATQPIKTGLASAPSGTMLSTVEDYANYMLAILNNGRLNKQEVLPPNAVKMVTTAQVPKEEMVWSYTYGYGLMVGKFKGHQAYYHTGGMPGYSSNVLMLPQQNLGIVLFTNGENLNRNKILSEIVKHLTPKKETVRFNFDESQGVLVTPKEGKEISGLYLQRKDLPTIEIWQEDEKTILKNRGVEYTLYYYPKANNQGQYVGVSGEGRKFRFRVGRNDSGEALFVQWWIRAFGKKGVANN